MIGVVLDMDDTLYPESQYVASGFRAVANEAGIETEPTADAVFAFLWGCFEDGVRGNTFQMLFERFPGLRDRCTIEELVQCYRDHHPTLEPFAGVAERLSGWRSEGVPLALISDGGEAEQQRKLDALGLASCFDPVVLTGHWGREFWKPHARAFEAIEHAWSLSGADLVYIADNPAKDFLEPNRRGWKTLRLRSEDQLRWQTDASSEPYAAQAEVASWDALAEQVRRWLDVR